ncbi:protocadherin Fat 4-like [Anomaloglossus baeobatrachus]|uniref:protocadherin Fat 4-like n=1 Tax=Anomaloglossus baeobatrachus TaxID=238106 RepID=UPI003F501D5A
MLMQNQTGTLTFPYSYNVCVALDSTENDFTYMQANQNVPVDNLVDADDSGLSNKTLEDSLATNPSLQIGTESSGRGRFIDSLVQTSPPVPDATKEPKNIMDPPPCLTVVSSQVHYSIVEEMRKDSVIANIADDLGLDIKQLSSRKMQILSQISEKHFYVSLENGNLYIKDRIDRETLCGAAPSCFLSFDAVVEKPFNVFKVTVEIQDINDNAPRFYHETFTVEMVELTTPGTRFALQNAEDPDIGLNSVQSYKLSDNQYFTLSEKISNDGSKSPELVLEKALDREAQHVHKLLLTALDGGNPVRSGTTVVNIIVGDSNDNFPIFTHDVYKVSVTEDIPVNATIIAVHATDRDEGVYAQVSYSFSKTSANVHHTGMFSIHPRSGDVKTNKPLDFEVVQNYELSIQAKDGGGLVAHCKLLIEVIDVNDNAPEISLTSLSSLIPEDSPPGTVIALVRVHDQDSGANGEVDCKLTEEVTFNLMLTSDSYYRIVTAGFIDREKVSTYNITILANDRGSPLLSNQKSITLEVSDINDNAPIFRKSTYIAYLQENNVPGASIFSIQASDIDTGENAKIIYTIFNPIAEDLSISSYLSINMETGDLYAQRSFDYEKHKEFVIQVTATDHGTPSLKSNVTLIIHIVNQNDNAPKILYPSPDFGGSSPFEMVPFASEPGSLITKVVAVDIDSGHNSWLSYDFLSITESAFFTINQQTGEIRTVRMFQEKDVLNHKVVVMVKDNGFPSLSATVTVSLVIADNFQKVIPKFSNEIIEDTQSNLQLYLIISLALILLLFIVTVLLVIISKCKESKPISEFGTLRTNLYPPIDPRILSWYSDGSLPLPNSYNVCVALESDESDFTYMKSNLEVPVENLIDADDSGLGNENTKDSINNSMQALRCQYDGGQLTQVSGQIHYSINEEIRKGSIVGNLAKDLELNVNDLSRRKLRIVSKISEKYFSINLDNGNLYIADRIDRETLCRAAADCVLTFDVVAENPLNVFSIKIDIQDINDNPPTFIHDQIKIEMGESSSPGRRFVLQKAEDLDVGVNSLISYRLSANEHFMLGEEKSIDGSLFPELILEKPLDRETESKYELILTAFDDGKPVQTGTATIKVMVTDFNDNVPIFTRNLYKVSVKETIPVNSTILQVSASDEDDGVNAQITYSFSTMANNILQSFLINPENGEIKTRQLLDYEMTKNYEVSVQAKDGGGLAAHAKILIELIDENDNAPEISIASISTPIPEDSILGTVVALLEIRDQDSGENGEVQCLITGNVPFQVVSSASNFYKIITKSNLDRESVPSYNITVQASDKGSPEMTSRTIIQLDVSDINDNPPIFEQSTYRAFVPENNVQGASIFSIHAKDIDDRDNAKVFYSIASINKEETPLSNYISINPATGVIYAQQSFDYEQHKEFNIRIIARDNGSPPLNGTTTFRISVVDQNDNSPIILYPSPEVDSSTFEMVPWTSEQGSLVSKVVAVDADSGHNAWLSYFLQSSEPSLFTIDQHTGEIRTFRVFHEKDAIKHGIVVLVKDNGIPSRSASVTFNIVVAHNFQQVLPELNSQSAKIEPQSNLQFYLVIALALISFLFVLTVIIAVVAKCKDSKSNTSFGPLSTSLYPQIDPRFLPQFNPGTLPLPYSYDVCVTLDPSEQEFAFLKPQHNVPVDSLIDADDPEIGNESLKNSSPTENLISQSSNLSNFYVMTVCKKLIFSGQIHYSINEELRNGCIVGNLAKDFAIQINELSNRKVRIVSRISEKYFSINLDNGNLYIADRIDRETLCGAAADCVLTFDVVAENPLNVFSIKIDIQDINDNPPTFIHERVKIELSEATSPGRRFVLQKAEDLDVGINSLISYRLSDNEHFMLGEEKGIDGSLFPELILEKPLDRETESKYELTLTAFDGGKPVQTGTTTIKVVVTDFNDNVPIFTQNLYKVSVKETISVNSTILQVSASDEDDGVNAQITYSFSTMANNILQTFLINPESGEIKTRKLLDYEMMKNYEVSVQAKDGGGLAAHAKVLIEVVDENDNAPEISIASISTPIPEDSILGTVVALLEIRDQDSGENGEVQCLITGNVPFQVVSSASNFYKIITKSNLDRESVPSYNITVQASDKGSPEMTTRTIIQLDVSDINDNPPIFEKLTYTAFVPENNAQGASIFSIHAKDIDDRDNAKVFYSIASINKEETPLPNYISINPVTGVIYAQQSFDYEQHKEFNIQIIARDNGSPPLNGTTTLRISVVDQNDNSPIILYPSPEVDSSTFEMVPWTSEQGSLVSKVVAVDADSGHNAWLSYFLQSSEPSLFTIDQHTGEIRTFRVFQEKDAVKHGIVVLVKDNGIPSRSASVTFNIVVAHNFQQVLPELNSQSAKIEPQSNLQFYLVIALALISFFFVLTVIIAVVAKCKDSKTNTSFGPLSTSLYPQIDPRFLPQFNPGTLPLPYSYDVCVTLDPSEQEFAVLKPHHNVPVDSLIDANDPEIGNKGLKNYSTAENLISQSSNLSNFYIITVCKKLYKISGQIYFSINEELRKGSIVGNLAKDLAIQIKELSNRKIRIVSRISEKYFSINLDNGNLYIADRIDRETLCGAAADCVLTFDVVAENPLNVFSIKIDIQDINDNPPTFIHDQIKIEMSEYTLPGRRFVLQKAEDLDVGVNSLISYRLSANEHFMLGEEKGIDGSLFPELILEKPLDRETVSKYELTLTAFDGGKPVQTGTTTIKVFVTDFNDNVPIFTQNLYKVSVKETIPVNSTILQVSASDEDDGVNAQITYSFSTMANNILQTFLINPESGEIETRKLLDYEMMKNYEVSVQAKDGGGLAAHAKVLIEVVDENDNAPEISIASISTPIPEDSILGTVVALLEIRDQDSGENGEVQCLITGNVPFQVVSSASNFYKIITKNNLDRERVPSYNITVQASDKGSPKMTSRTIIQLEVSDINDNAPIFEKLTYTAFVPENNAQGASIFSIHAKDIDDRDNAKVFYSISSINKEETPLSNYISINPVTGVIYAQQSFDYEQHKEFNIQIIARDNGSPPLNGSTTLRISVVDQNDNSPVILYPSPEVDGSTFEMVPWTSEQGSLISKVVAVDADSGHNAWLSYFLQSSEPLLFTIDQHTGEIRTFRVFQEKDAVKHGIVVLVKDNGIPSRSASVTFNIVVAHNFQQVLPELNSQSAKIEPQSNLQFYLVVALALISFFFVLTVIIAVVAKCKDSKSNTSFGPLSTSLYPQIDPRFLSQFNPGTLPLPYSYDVCVTLDPSEQEFAFLKPQHNVPVESLIDADDPEIGNESLKNSSPTEILMSQNRLHDADSVQLQEEIHSISHWDVPGTGLIEKTDYFLLDYKYNREFYYYISVSGQIHYSINEELRKGSIVGNLAKDLELDIKDLPRRKLSIVSDLSEKYFNINPDNGNLYIVDRIDRETLCRAAADCVLTFDVVAKNPLNVFSVKINVQDINDNAPKFVHNILSLEMSESTSPGAKFVLQKAEDLDVGVNSLISYRLSENQYFALGEKVSTDGSVFPELILEKPLDRETQNKHELILTASDGGNPVQTGTALINIIINDINDNSPVFTQDVYKVSVRENIPVNSTILQVSASDEDEGVNAQITYSFSTTENHFLQTFTINPKNGEIKTKEHLDYEKNKYYEISVEAKDGGGLAAHAKVIIEVTDENDNAPEISITSSSDLIPEDSPPGTVVALIKVHDRDSGENGEVQCIITQDLPFKLLSSSSNFYKIVTKSSLDREKLSSYNITIQASDKGSPEKISRKLFRLDVSDVNDNAPVFDKLSYTAFIPENNSPGTSIFNIHAKDMDSEDNAKITYSILSKSNEDDTLSSYISMNPVTGVIYAQRSFDYEKHKQFNIQIIARDNGSPSLNSSTTLRICIVDQNDNSPVILYPSPEHDSSTFEMVPWTSEQGSLVSKVVAVDADSGHNAWLSYFLQSSEPSLFNIDQHTGEIRTSRGFHEKEIMKHGIVVLVKDNGIPSRSASVTLTMVIADHFHQVLPELSSQSNKEESQSSLQFYLVIALALISFFFMLTVIIAVVSKYKDSKSTTSFGSLSTSLYPPIDPRFISQFNSGTLPLPYSYDVCVTLDPSEQEFAFVQPQHNVPVDSLIDADDSGIGNEISKNSTPAGNLIPQGL